jgi:hypothetical protein
LQASFPEKGSGAFLFFGEGGSSEGGFCGREGGGIGVNTGGDIPGAEAAGAIALFEFLLEFLLDGDFAGAEDVVGEEAEDAGLFEGHAVLGEELEDFGEGAVDVLGRGEGAGAFG